MKKEVSLRKLDWPEIIVHFTLLPSKVDFSSKDLVDYFQFRYINSTTIERWIPPNYLRQTSCAKKILGLYGRDLSIAFIDIMFDKHKEIFGKDFNQIIWSLGVLSSEKTGFILERIIKEYEKRKSEDDNFVLKRLLEKNRSEWMPEEREFYQKEIANGKT